MSNLTPELQKQIEQEAIDATKDRKDTDFDIGWNQGYEKGYEAAGIKYALKWQAAEASAKERGKIITTLNNRLTNIETALKEAEQRAERYEKALRGILETTPTVSGANTMRFIAREALTPKTTTDDTVNE